MAQTFQLDPTSAMHLTIDTLQAESDTEVGAPSREKSPLDEVEDEHLFEHEEELHCAECGQAITRPKFQTRIGGKFQHTCVNPAGILFEIGCFSQAAGCREIGPESDDFTWFDGYTWQVAICSSCRSHLGWRFWSSEDSFFGLILNRLA
jgi:hypothetical protein